MKIDSSPKVSSKSSSTKKKVGTTGPAFSSFMGGEEETTVSSTSAVMPVSAVAMINEVEDVNPDERRKQAIDHGNELLDELENLRDGLVMGTLSETDLQKAYRLSLKQREHLDDPELEFLINEIEVRSAVELAKLGLI